MSTPDPTPHAIEITGIPDDSLLAAEAAPLVSTAPAQIASTEEATEAQRSLKGIAALRKRFVAIFEAPKKAAHAAHREITGAEKALLAPLDTARKRIEAALLAFEAEQERIAREAQRKAEQERREREERERKILEEQALAEAAAAEEAGDAGLAEELLQRAETVQPEPELEPPAPVAAPAAVQGVARVETWGAEVVDLMALVQAVAAGTQPLGLLQADEKKLGALAKSLKGELRIPGVRAVSKKGLRVG